MSFTYGCQSLWEFWSSLFKKGGVPSVCLLEILHRGSKACYGLDVNVGACTMTGLKSELRVA